MRSNVELARNTCDCDVIRIELRETRCYKMYLYLHVYVARYVCFDIAFLSVLYYSMVV